MPQLAPARQSVRGALACLTLLHVLRVVLDLDGHGVEMELPLQAGAGCLQHSLGICILSWWPRRPTRHQRTIYLLLGP